MSDTAPGREALREALLLATLPHVAFDGWGQKALMAGARDAGVAPPLALNAFPGGATEMIEYFNSWADRRAGAALAARGPSPLKGRERITLGVRLRIEPHAPHRQAVRLALAPPRVPTNPAL